jgi:hypothetical protein
MRIRLVNIVEEVLKKMGIDYNNQKLWVNSLRRKSLIMQMGKFKDFNSANMINLYGKEKLKEFMSVELSGRSSMKMGDEPLLDNIAQIQNYNNLLKNLEDQQLNQKSYTAGNLKSGLAKRSGLQKTAFNKRSRVNVLNKKYRKTTFM